MENHNSDQPTLLLRLSTNPRMEEDPPNLLSRLTTPPLGKRKREYSSELSSKWKSSGRGNVPASKPRRELQTNWASGKERQIRRRERPLISTSPKSTHSLLSRMRTDQPPEDPPNLLKRLSSPSNEPPGKESEKRSTNFWIKYPEENSTENLV